MRTLKLLPLTLFLLFLSLSSCKKKKLEIPPIRFDAFKLPIVDNSGRNYAGYLVDGEPVWSQKEPTFFGNYVAEYSVKSGLLYLPIGGNNVHMLYIDIRSPLRLNETYLLKDGGISTNSTATYYFTKTVTDKPNTIIPYISTDGSPGTIKIVYWNTQRKIIAGEFELTVQNQTKTETKQITKGRFDFTYQER